MKVFVAYKHTGESFAELRKLLELVRDAFRSLEMEVCCTFFDEDEFQRKEMSAGAIMSHAFSLIDGCDILFVVQASSEKSEGMIMEVGYCIAKGIPVVVAARTNVENTYLPEMGSQAFYWETFDDLAEGIKVLFMKEAT